MSTNNLRPGILALDFDGVLCDGLAEYFQSSKLTYQEIWDSPPVGDELESVFGRLRPIIETGWEMPILLRALVLGITEAEILGNWSELSRDIVVKEDLTTQAIAKTLDQVRDRFIQTNLEGWLGLQRFYPGVIERVKTILETPTIIYIISTKEGRFIKELLHQSGVEIAPEFIIGKESKRPKYQTITQLLNKHNCQPKQVWFVEDRLDALKLVENQANLAGVGLFLADWGYNTPEMRESIGNSQSIKLLSLEQFQQNFDQW
jgi:phosphoglycolate phosphatase-like HAD superfamily hydrolase